MIREVAPSKSKISLTTEHHYQICHRMGALRVTDWQKGVPFCLSDVSVQLMAQKWPTTPTVISDSER